MSHSTAQAFFADPQGSWPSDLSNEILLECTHIPPSSTEYVDIYRNALAIKSAGGTAEKNSITHEIAMTLLAGADCALPVVGRYFFKGVVIGFVTAFEKCIAERTKGDILPEIHQQRLSVINQFCSLLDRLHSKGMVHGDVKPSNLVLDDAGNLRFIDFAQTVLEADQPCYKWASSTHYDSPSSMRPGATLTRADDLYAAGVTIWHIYVGRVPFENIDIDDLDARIAAGLRPDLSLIDDEGVKALIAKYLREGEPDKRKVLACVTNEGSS